MSGKNDKPQNKGKGDEIVKISWAESKVVHEKMGQGIHISPKSDIEIQEGRTEYNFPNGVCQVFIGIGNDNSAFLLMDKGALEALRNSEDISITTNFEFKEGKK